MDADPPAQGVKIARRMTSKIEIVECADDQEATHKALQAVDGHNVELWELSRFVARFPSHDPK